MKCHTNVNSTPPTQLLHKFSYIVAILIHNQFELLNISNCFEIKNPPPVELCWQKKRNPQKMFNFFGLTQSPAKI
jgi:hypothetical protein